MTKPFVWSYSFLNDFENCPHKAFRRYIKRDLSKEASPALEKGRFVHDALQARINGKQPLPAACADAEKFVQQLESVGVPLQAEVEFGLTPSWQACSAWDKHVAGRGRLDVLMIILDAKAPVAILTDWKTGKVREDPFELEVQAVLLQAHYPDLQHIVGQYIWLQAGHGGVTHILSDTTATKQKIIRLLTDASKYASVGEWPKQQNPLCGWCPVKDCVFNRNR